MTNGDFTNLQIRRDTAAQWATVNPVLKAGEPGYETDTGKVKVGNGNNDWNSLPYLTGAGGAGTPGATGAMGPPGWDAEEPEMPWVIPGGVGKDGAAGSPGTPGAAGRDGLMGPPGFDAEEPEMPWVIPGQKGDTGAQGAQGNPGTGGSGGGASFPMPLDPEEPEMPWIMPGPPGAAGSASGIAHSFLGRTTIGGSTETMTDNRVYAKKITLTADGWLTSIDAYLDGGADTDRVQSVSVAVYDDTAGTPNRIIAQGQAPDVSVLMDDTVGAGGSTDPRWFQTPIMAWLTAGDYWITVQLGDNNAGNLATRLYYDATGTDRFYTSGGRWFADWGWYAPTTSANNYSIRASVALPAAAAGAWIKAAVPAFTTPVTSGTFTVNDPLIGATSKVIIVPCGELTSGHRDDMDVMHYSAHVTGAGVMVVRWSSVTGYTSEVPDLMRPGSEDAQFGPGDIGQTYNTAEAVFDRFLKYLFHYPPKPRAKGRAVSNTGAQHQFLYQIAA